jgi:ribosomal-protein-alanine N-acetyltransferase
MSNLADLPDLRGLAPRGNDLVLLRPWQEADLPAIAEAGSDPYIPQITSVPAQYTAAAGAAWLQRQRDQLAQGRGCPMAIWARNSARVVGLATIARINWVHRRGDVGYWILPRHRGQGYARAAAALLPGIAREIGLVRIEALVEPANHASQAVCRAAGFVPEGRLRSYYRIGDENRDMIMFSLLPTADGPLPDGSLPGGSLPGGSLPGGPLAGGPLAGGQP